MSGMRVKCSWIFNAAGQFAPLCVSISGLTKVELPSSKCPSVLLRKKINGLCIGGNSMNPKEDQLLPAGYLLLLRNDKDGEQDKKENIVLPFIASTRKQHDN